VTRTATAGSGSSRRCCRFAASRIGYYCRACCRAIWGSWPRRGNAGQAGQHRLFAREYLDGIAVGARQVRCPRESGHPGGRPHGRDAARLDGKGLWSVRGESRLQEGFGFAVSHHESGDVAVIQPIRKADAGHMCMDDGTQWVSDFKQPCDFIRPPPTKMRGRPSSPLDIRQPPTPLPSRRREVPGSRCEWSRGLRGARP